jgi:long-chain acyl-CoA synthetase
MKTKYPFYDIAYEFHTIPDLIIWAGKTYAEYDAFHYYEGNNITSKKYREFLSDVQCAAKFFLATMEKGSHVAIVGETSYAWIVAWAGAVFAGCVAVPIDRLLNVETAIALLEQVNASTLVFAPSHEEIEKAIKSRNLPINCICMESNHESSSTLHFDLSDYLERDITLDRPNPEDIAEIVFTSGTTGKYKGCILTQNNLAWNVMNGSSYVKLDSGSKTMSILPIHHTLEMTAGILTPLCFGVTICINNNLRYIQKNLNRYHPECMIAVPMVVEMLYKNIWITAKKLGQQKKLKMAIAFSKLLQKLHIHVERRLFSSVLENLGSNLKLLVVGGAHLDPKYVTEFSAMGITIVQGYGVTECGPVVACNTDRKWNAASVGKVVTGCAVKIVDGEIWVNGPIVMKGYYDNDLENEAAFEDGWYKTGDLGWLDRHGYLYITGRKKNLITLSNGENVSPEELEEKIRSISGVAEVVVSEEKNQLKAEIFLEAGTEKDAVQQSVNIMNKSMPSYKAIRNVVFRDTPFPKTTTQKIKRAYSNVEKGMVKP